MMKMNKSLHDKFDRLTELGKQEAENTLKDIADAAVEVTLFSPRDDMGKVGAVDTGAYLDSFSFVTGSGRPRGKSSRGKRRGRTDSHQLGQTAKTDLYSDIAKLDFEDKQTITLRNASPHAYHVETRYNIFGQLKRRFDGY